MQCSTIERALGGDWGCYLARGAGRFAGRGTTIDRSGHWAQAGSARHDASRRKHTGARARGRAAEGAAVLHVHVVAETVRIVDACRVIRKRNSLQQAGRGRVDVYAPAVTRNLCAINTVLG